MAELSAISSGLSRRFLLSGAAGLALTGALTGMAACGRKKDAVPEAPPAPAGPPEGSLEWALAGPWRAQDRPRDAFRNPMETLRFFGL